MEINFKYLCLYMYVHNSKAETKMRGMKNLVWISVVAMLVMAMAGVGKASPEIVLYTDPWLSVADPGETFDVYVTASGLVDDFPLFGAEFFMNFSATVLAVVDDPATTEDVEGINLGDVEPYLDHIFIEKANNDEGWLHVVMGRPVGVKEGLTGTVQIAKITFLVEAEGSCDLTFYNDPDMPGVEPRLKGLIYERGALVHVDLVERTVEDGLFRNIPFPHDISITSVTVSPDTVGAGGSVSITVDVENQGTETESFDVTVYYDNTTIGTKTVTNLAAGANTTLEFTWDTTGVALDTYTIKANATVHPEEVDTRDNVRTRQVTVEEATGLGINLYLVAGLAIVGVVAALIVVRWVRKPKPT